MLLSKELLCPLALDTAQSWSLQVTRLGGLEILVLAMTACVKAAASQRLGGSIRASQ